MLKNSEFTLIHDIILCLTGLELRHFSHPADLVRRTGAPHPEDRLGLITAIHNNLHQGVVLHLQTDNGQYVLFRKSNIPGFYGIGPFCSQNTPGAAYPQADPSCLLAAVGRITGETCLIRQITLSKNAPPSTPGSRSRIIQNVVRYIQDNLSSKISLRSIAQHIGFSETCISHYFKQELGISPMRYILHQRIYAAQGLLRATDLTVQDIAVQVGIPDCSYFTKVFHATVGCTPTQYRESL